jgi:Skp family chaperone for outer membrane proteins
MKERNDMLGNILKDIEKVVSEYSKANNYDIILNSRMLLYGKEDIDLTKEILGKLNK